MQNRSKFETLRREIKADFRKQHALYVNNLVGDVKVNPRDFIGTSIVIKKTPKVSPFKKEEWKWGRPIGIRDGR